MNVETEAVQSEGGCLVEHIAKRNVIKITFPDPVIRVAVFFRDDSGFGSVGVVVRIDDRYRWLDYVSVDGFVLNPLTKALPGLMKGTLPPPETI